MPTRKKPAPHETMEDGTMGKKCNRCMCVKPLVEYSKNSAKWDSLSEFCRACGIAYNRKNQEARNEKNARFRKKHHEVIKERVRLCVRKRRAAMAPGEDAAKQREYRARNLERCRKYQRDYTSKNVEKRRNSVRKYTKNNRLKVNAYRRTRRATDPVYAISCRLRERLANVLRKRKFPKHSKSYDLIGCDAVTIKQHLESKFTVGMSWEAFHRGEIHIDHIKPVSKFDLSNEEGQRAAFHYTNLQPLWNTDNWAKSDKWTEPAPDPFSV